MDKLFSMIEVEVNSHCNRTCWYCPNSISKRQESGEMKPELFQRLMEQLRSLDFAGRISFHFYGEPLLCKNLDLFVGMASEYIPRARPIIYTNGDLLDAKRLRNLLELGIKKFIVTQHVGAKHKFKEVFVQLSEEEKEQVVYLDHSDLVLSNRGGILSKVPHQSKASSICMVPSNLVVVTVMGNVLPCFEDFNQKLVMGNINEQHIAEIWNNERFSAFRKLLSEGHRNQSEICKNCNNVSVQTEVQYDYVL
ncbi:SPASM domain-containing protein [Paenibacillus sp. MZ04-78.2]|uniref:radical SAM/SPASM domain-containing protein n=1 Tax=Paenibacillus sp. MZ04-78.2 TaxID=2962034 RepID=UPI0020B88232|nr:SPASM domain-containing protein [Paenibacillus sp. MZ04-78.2]MCP3776459.1 SPASM domain-containing protein [Paenibacillus sp. MZ04-78.2]